jgi:hypothetical protein
MVVDAGSVDAGDASPAGAAGSASVGGSSGQAGVGGSGQTNANLISNGDFSDGESDWAVTDLAAANGADADAMVIDGALCTAVDATGAFVVLGWPQDLSTAVHLSAGQTYTLSYDVRASGRSNEHVTRGRTTRASGLMVTRRSAPRHSLRRRGRDCRDSSRDAEGCGVT